MSNVLKASCDVHEDLKHCFVVITQKGIIWSGAFALSLDTVPSP